MREKEDHYKNLDEETSRLVGKFLDIPVLKENHEKYRDERGKVNMCTAIRDMVKKRRRKKRQTGPPSGREKPDRRSEKSLRRQRIPRQAVPGIRNIASLTASSDLKSTALSTAPSDLKSTAPSTDPSLRRIPV